MPDSGLEARFIEGDAAKPALVFLHEGLGSVSLWKHFPEQLAQRTGCRALVYSRAGNGSSPALEAKFEPSYLHDEALRTLPAMLDRFEIDDALLIGHSDGASIALIYAGENGARIRGLVAEAPHVFVEDITVQSIARARVAFETTDLAEKLGRHHARAARAFYGWNEIWLDPRFRDWNIRESVKKIGVPMLLVQGAGDEYGTFAQIEAIRGDAPVPIDVLYLARCGHSPHRDRPEMVLAAMTAFIAERLASPRES